jgi:tripartite-type tricarboxylate transporter receptor subunit TctC
MKILHETPLADTLCCAAALVLSSMGIPAAAADRYPSKPIRIIVPSAPGGGPDTLSRMIGPALTQAWGRQVVTDNRAGAAGNIGAEIAARAAPDGYTLLIASVQQIVGPLFFDNPPYHLIRDFSPVCLIVSTPFVLVIDPSVAATSVKELVALAKAKPGTLYYGSSGTGGTLNLLGEMFKTMADINLVHVPYKSSSFMLIDMVGGQVQLAIAALPAAAPLIKQGKLRALAVTSLKRTPLAPELEPIAETVPGYELIGWYGLVAPIKTPDRIVAMLNTEIIKALKSAEIQDKLQAIGAEPVGSTPREFASLLSAQTEAMRKTIETSGMRPN